MAIRVNELPTEAHPFAPAGSVVIGVKCPDMPTAYLVAFAPPVLNPAQVAAMEAMGLPLPEGMPLSKMAMGRRAVLAAAGAGVFAVCHCDERFWMKYGDTHEIHTGEDVPPHSACQVNAHVIGAN